MIWWWIAISVAGTLVLDWLMNLEPGSLPTPLRGEGYRPKQSSLPRAAPPGSSVVPRKSGGYRPSQSVNPRTVRPPSSPSAVTPPSHVVQGGADAEIIAAIQASRCTTVQVEREDPLWSELVPHALDAPDCKGAYQVPRAAWDAATSWRDGELPDPNPTRPHRRTTR